MIKLLDLKDIRLASVNKMFIPKTHFLTNEYKAFKKLIALACLNVPIKSPVKLTVEVRTCMDIDNFLKPLQDALEKAIGNDKEVLELHVYKEPKKRTKGFNLSDLKVYACQISEVT